MNVTTRDGKSYVLERELYSQSIFLRHLAQEMDMASDAEPVGMMVDSDVFDRILEFMQHHRNDPEVAEDYDPLDILFSDFDRAFVDTDNVMLFRITSAANYLYMPFLLELCCKSIAESLKEKTTEEIKRYLAIPGDEHPPGEIDRIRKEYRWIN